MVLILRVYMKSEQRVTAERKALDHGLRKISREILLLPTHFDVFETLNPSMERETATFHSTHDQYATTQ
jgi:hypothetical protein